MIVIEVIMFIAIFWMALCAAGWAEFALTDKFCLYLFYGKIGLPPFANFADEDNTGCYSCDGGK